MKKLPLLILLIFTLGCQNDELINPKKKKLYSEEYYTFSVDSNKFIPSHKKVYHYKNEKLSSIEVFNGTFTSFDSEGYLFEKYDYFDQGRLKKLTRYFAGHVDEYSHIWEYEYSGNITTVTYYENRLNWQGPKQKYILERKEDGKLELNYYDHLNQLYWHMKCDVDEKGNVVSIVRTPSSNILVNFKYDDSPNPLYFPEVIDHPFSEKFYSKNNVTEIESQGMPNIVFALDYDSDHYLIKKEYISTADHSYDYRQVFTYN